MALKECHNCGGQVSSNADQCPHCGAPPAPPVCWECGKEVGRDDEICPHCGVGNPTGEPPQATAKRQLKSYYREQFQKFEANGGNFTPTWNWPAFFFGPFWYFYRGMWVKAIILAVVALASAGIGWILAVGWGAVVGNYDYYLLIEKDTQLYPQGSQP